MVGIPSEPALFIANDMAKKNGGELHGFSITVKNGIYA